MGVNTASAQGPVEGSRCPRSTADGGVPQCGWTRGVNLGPLSAERPGSGLVVSSTASEARSTQPPAGPGRRWRLHIRASVTNAQSVAGARTFDHTSSAPIRRPVTTPTPDGQDQRQGPQLRDSEKCRYVCVGRGLTGPDLERSLCAGQGTRVRRLPCARLSRRSGTPHRGVLATRGTGMEGTTLRLPAAAGEI